MSSFSYLPVWKKNATPEERFLELAMMAKAQPERFDRVVIVYEEDTGQGTITRTAFSENLSTTEALGVLEAGKMEMYLGVKGLTF